MTLVAADVRREFPVFAEPGTRLAYLDNAATTQKPRRVLEAMNELYRSACANVHRSAYRLAAQASDAYEGARERIRSFVGAAHSSEILFTSGATGSINAVADGLRRRGLAAGSEIVVSVLEHHSNFVPWQRLCAEAGAQLVVVPCDALGCIDLRALELKVGPRTALVACTHVSNVLGTIQPIHDIVRIARRHGALTLIDGAQAAPRLPLDLSALGADFYVFSAHKAYGPFGIGVLYACASAQAWLAPYQTGGGMIERVEEGDTSFAPAPARFEAGTPNLAGAVGLAAATDYLTTLAMPEVAAHEQALLEHCVEALCALPGVQLIGAPQLRSPAHAGLLSFTVDRIHPHDLATVLDHAGVAIRAGQHCAQPLLHRLGVSATARVSFGIYNDRDDVAALSEGVCDAIRRWRG